MTAAAISSPRRAAIASPRHLSSQLACALFACGVAVARAEDEVPAADVLGMLTRDLVLASMMLAPDELEHVHRIAEDVEGADGVGLASEDVMRADRTINFVEGEAGAGGWKGTGC